MTKFLLGAILFVLLFGGLGVLGLLGFVLLHPVLIVIGVALLLIRPAAALFGAYRPGVRGEDWE